MPLVTLKGKRICKLCVTDKKPHEAFGEFLRCPKCLGKGWIDEEYQEYQTKQEVRARYPH